MQDLVIILWVGDWRPSYKWYCTASSGAAGRSDQNGQFQVWWETSGKPSLCHNNQQSDSCPWCCPPKKAWLQKEPETTAMACGNMSGNNFFNNVRRASNAPLTVDQWRANGKRTMVFWTSEPCIPRVASPSISKPMVDFVLEKYLKPGKLRQTGVTIATYPLLPALSLHPFPE